MSILPSTSDSLPPAVTALISYGTVNPARTNDLASWFREQVYPHETALRSYLRRRFPTVTDIDDLVQEAYARMFRARDAGVVFEPRAYLFVVARNAAYDIFRRRRDVSLEELEEGDGLALMEDADDAAEITSHAQEIDLLSEAIKALPNRCREVLVLRRLHGLSYREIAQRLGIAEATVNAQLAIGMVRCRRYLEARGVLKGGGDAS